MLVLELGSAFTVTFLISMLLIRFAPIMQVAIKAELESVQSLKRGTPTIGGLAFVLGTTAVTLLFPNRFENSVLLPLLSLVLFAAIGLVDDLFKTRKSSGDGVSSLTKLLLQALVAAVLLFLLQRSNSLTTTIMLPLLKGKTISLAGA
ncbi:MAG: hypothetical protein PHR69_02770, partial [Sphaerochaeta sp.]|nr:hypothetical protein [Sphaerochaeta sp.]